MHLKWYVILWLCHSGFKCVCNTNLNLLNDVQRYQLKLLQSIVCKHWFCHRKGWLKKKKQKKKTLCTHTIKFNLSTRIEINMYNINRFVLFSRCCMSLSVYFFSQSYHSNSFNCTLSLWVTRATFSIWICTSWCDSICIYLHIQKH